MYRSVIDEITNIDDNDKNFRPSIIIKRKRKIYEKTFASKWANFKLFLKERKSLESSVKLQKKNTIDQFSSKCKEIYKNKKRMNELSIIVKISCKDQISEDASKNLIIFLI